MEEILIIKAKEWSWSSIYFDPNTLEFSNMYDYFSLEQIFWILEDLEYNEYEQFYSYDFLQVLNKYFNLNIK